MSRRLLFDQNLPRRMVSVFTPHFPQSAHVTDFGLATASDREVWDFAAEEDFVIISKDGDFHQMSFLYGAPPKVIWLRLGNSSTDDAIAFLNDRLPTVDVFLDDAQSAILVLQREAR